MGDKFEMAEVRRLSRQSKPKLAGSIIRGRHQIQALQGKLAHCEWALYQARKHTTTLGTILGCVLLAEVALVLFWVLV